MEISSDIKLIDYIPINDMHQLVTDYDDVKNNDILEYVILLLNNFKCDVNVNEMVIYIISDDTNKKYAHLLNKIESIKQNINYEHIFCYSWNDELKLSCELKFDVMDNNKDDIICSQDICCLFNKLTRENMIIDKTIIIFVITCLQNNIDVDKCVFISGLKKINDFYK